jgi:hypothetical protein
MKKHAFSARPAAALLAVLCAAAPLSAAMTAWTENSLAKIAPTDPLGGSASVSISAGGNEWVSFQVVVTAGTDALQGVDAAVSDFSGPGGVISAAASVVVYREGYYDVAQISDPRGSVGQWPDALFPKVDPYFHEARNAFPFPVPAGSNQPLWFDVYVPAGTAPGTYTATVTVIAAGQPAATVPVALQVRNFQLPATPSLPSLYGYDEFAAMVAHDPVNRFNYDWPTIFSELTVPYLKMLVRHRVGIDYDSQDGTDSAFDNGTPVAFHWDLFDQNVGAALDGTLPDTFGNRLAAIDLPDIESGWGDSDKSAIWHEWSSHFRARGWWPLLYDYPGLCDEPDPADTALTAAIRAHASLLHGADAGYRLTSTTAIKYAINSFQQSDSPLIGSLDVWVPNVVSLSLKNPDQCSAPANEVPRADYDAEVAADRAVWAYQSCNSQGCEDTPNDCSLNYPAFMIDVPATHNRIMQWMTWFQRASGELYYALNYADSARTAAEEYDNLYDFGGNGDGTLVYPGTPDIIGGTTHIPIESIRLKQIRDGEQDFEYLTLLAARGMRTQADSLVASLVTNDYTFNDSPSALLAARETAAELLEGGGPPPPSGCTPDANTLCLNGARFEVRVQWTDFQGNTGAGNVVPGVSSPDSGLFWFFGPDNWEMLVKVLNGCDVNGNYWVFAAATTNVQYTLQVTDMQSGEVKTYTNPLGTSSPAITDAGAFASCP